MAPKITNEIKQQLTKIQTINDQLTRFNRWLNDITSASQSIDSRVCNELQLRIQQIEPLFSKFENIHTLLTSQKYNITGIPDIEDFESTYFSTLGKARDLLSKNASSNEVSRQTNLTRVENNNNTQTTEQLQVRLPVIDLPTFNGTYSDWETYKDTFVSLIHENNNLTNIQKFHYLKSTLRNNALKLLDNIQVSNSNYTIAWELLVERFENKKLIINDHIKAIYEFPVMQRESGNYLREIHDVLKKHLRALENLGEPVKQWNSLINYIITAKFDTQTKRAYTEFTKDIAVPEIDKLYEFLKERAYILEQLDSNKVNLSNKIEHKQLLQRPKKDQVHGAHASTSNTIICPSCKANHYLFQCEKFKALTVNARFNLVKELKLCKNCLNSNHKTSECSSSYTCKECKRKHHTLIHFENNTNVSNSSRVNHSSNITTADNNPTTLISHSLQSANINQTLLSTVCILATDSVGNQHLCRALLDSGSQSNFISQELCNKLKLKTTKVTQSVFGINCSLSKITDKTEIQIQSRHSFYSTTISCLILPKITERMPVNSFDSSTLNIPSSIQLADDTFNKCGKIDMLIGAEKFWNLLCIGQIRLGVNKPILHKTKLGWIVSGKLLVSDLGSTMENLASNYTSFTYCSTENNSMLQDQIAKFWNIEEPTISASKLTPEESECETHFQDSIKRDKSGRFIVTMPLNSNSENLGNSRQQCLQRFYRLERRLQSEPQIKKEYTQFMTEYLTLDHMTEVNQEQEQSPNTYYLPHHAVVKSTSLTTKLRVVFDGSAKTDTGLSLNDIQLMGPILQSDLFSIIIRFRKHLIALTGDIMKMYRQIWINPEQRKLLRIFWRNEPNEELKCYELKTVTYGTKSAPYLATKCLHYLAEQCKGEYSRTCKIIQEDTYVDDVLTGGETVTEVLQIYKEITSILSSAGFELRKFLSNSPEVLNFIETKVNVEHTTIDLGLNENIKTLGVVWNASSDTIQYTTNVKQHGQITKRSILSTVSQIFDPLGLLGPIIVLAKIIIQELWKLKISWDESVPAHIQSTWSKFIEELPILKEIQIPRHVLCEIPNELELHGFSDACETSYGACIYLRSVDQFNNVTVRLLCAKSKVAPLKPITIPRLELLGALMLSRLYNKVENCMQLKFSKVTFWCDSTIVLSWIQTEPYLLKTFVSNRISEIQNLTNKANWHYVPTSSNPADIISRGLIPSKLIHSKLWWEGPSWLSSLIYDIPTCPTNCENKTDDNLATVNFLNSTAEVEINDLFLNNLFDKFSSFQKLQRVVAYCIRFKSNCLKTNSQKNVGHLTVQEIQYATTQLIKIAQHQSFKTEIHTLQKKELLNSKSAILSLNPFLDEQGLLRVGGRLQQSDFDYNKKYPILLPSKHTLTNLIMTSEHKRLLHCGAQTLLASVRELYWPIGGKNLAKKIIRNCVVCFRTNPQAINHIMGNLPKVRITVHPPFFNVGVDYAGPIFLKEKKFRNTKLLKAYICLFVCLGTKAIHLELVSSLTTEAFMATLRRFISRRGKPKNIYSDNGSNFVGCNHELRELAKFLQQDDTQNYITSSLSEDFISWHFIPPRSPHFAGIWEAGVKSTKQHLKRIIGNASLTFEECCTILTQIEAILNSRPLTPISTDPNDLSALTPAHFLIGRSLVALPDHDLMEVPVNKLSRYQRLQQLVQHFWNRWSTEYISTLQNRTKWKQNYPNILKEGSLVLIRDKNLPPQKWQLARVLQLHPGSDNVVRVVTLKLPNQVTKRAVKGLCVLPTL